MPVPEFIYRAGDMPLRFDQVISKEDQLNVAMAKADISRVVQTARLVIISLPDFIDARWAMNQPIPRFW